jgi:hypothetical protein
MFSNIHRDWNRDAAGRPAHHFVPGIVLQRYKSAPRNFDMNSDLAISISVAVYVVHAYWHTAYCTAYMHTAHCVTCILHAYCGDKRQDSHLSGKMWRDFPSAGSTSLFRHSATAVQLPSFCCVSISTAYLQDCRLLAATAPLDTVAAPRMAGQSITRRGVVVWG